MCPDESRHAAGGASARLHGGPDCSSRGGFADLPTSSKRSYFGKAGCCFIGTAEDRRRGYDDSYKGELRSPEFTTRGAWLSMLVGGGNHPDTCFVAVCRASDGEELFRATGRNNEYTRRVRFDISGMQGERLYIRVVDERAGGWGHVNLDDVRLERR